MRKPSPSLVIALIALFVALGGPAGAAKLISGSKIKPNSVTSRQIKDRTVTTTDIANRTLTSGDISKATLASLKRTSDSVTGAQIVDGTVGLADLGFGSVTGNQVVDRSITAVDVAADSLSASELAASSVGNAELALDSITSNRIAMGGVTKGDVASGAVGGSEVLNGDLTGKDIGVASGVLSATFGSVPGDSCATPQTFTGSTEAYAIPAGTMAGAAILVSPPVDGLTATARGAADGNTLSLQVCNQTAVPITASGAYPFVAIKP